MWRIVNFCKFSYFWCVFCTIYYTNKLIEFFLAAHCFWDDNTRERTMTNLKSEFKIAVGKYFREYYKPKDNRYTDFFEVND